MRAIVPQLKRVLLQLLLLLLLYSLSRVVFMGLHGHLFPELDGRTVGKVLVGGWRYDLSAILTINALYLLLFLLPLPIWRLPRWEAFTQWLFLITNALALAFEISDWGYFPFNLKRATLDVFNMLSRQADFFGQLPHFLRDYWYAPLGFLALVAILFVANRKIREATRLLSPDLSMNWVIGLWQSVAWILIMGLSVIGIRGGLQLVPIGNQNAVQVAGTAHVPLVLNTPFSIMHSYSEATLEELHYFADKDLADYVHPIKQYRGGTFRPRNVVYIILESFSKEYTGLGGRTSYTPFLDSLMRHAFVCTNAWANSLHSAEGVPCVISGLPSLMEEPITTSVYGTNHLTALPALLKRKGYESAFYHGGTNGTMGFDIYASGAGFDRYYGRKEYGNEADFDGAWGIWDEPFLQYFARGLGQMKQPFTAAVFTLSSHDPFKVPAQYQEQLPKGPLPIMQTIAYTDHALRQFFKTASKEPWYKQTLFVISPDHAAPVTEDSFYSNYNMGRYAIPLVFFAPGDTGLRGTTDRLVQQLDILPTVLDYLHYEHPFFALGSSIFRDDVPHFAVNELTGRYEWLMQDYLLTWTQEKPEGLYHFRTDSMCRHNLLQQEPRIVRSLETYFKAFRQAYHSAMIHNQMWVD